MGLTYLGFQAVPIGFIPEQDKGYLVLNAQLARRRRLDRTDKVVREMSKIAREEPGVAHTIDLPGYSAVLGTNISNVGGMFVILDPFEERAGKPELGAPAIIDAAAREIQRDHRGTRRRVRCAAGRRPGHHRRIQAASARPTQRRPACPAGCCRKPCRRGQPRSAPGRIVHAASASPSRSSMSISTEKKPRPKVINLKDIDATLQAYLGSFYVNDFFFQNRNWQVNVQAAPRYRMKIEDIGNLEVRNGQGQPRAAADVDQRDVRQRSGDRQPLQPLPVRRDQRQHGAGRQLRSGDRHHGRLGRQRRCPTRWDLSGRS